MTKAVNEIIESALMDVRLDEDHVKVLRCFNEEAKTSVDIARDLIAKEYDLEWKGLGLFEKNYLSKQANDRLVRLYELGYLCKLENDPDDLYKPFRFRLAIHEQASAQ
jgi:hypothetical protein